MPQSTSTRPPRTVYISERLWDEVQHDWFEQNLRGRRIGKSDHLELILRRGLQQLRRGRTSAADAVSLPTVSEPMGEESSPLSDDTPTPSGAAAAVRSSGKRSTGGRSSRSDARSSIQARLQRIAAAPGKPIPLPGGDQPG